MNNNSDKSDQNYHIVNKLIEINETPALKAEEYFQLIKQGFSSHNDYKDWEKSDWDKNYMFELNPIRTKYTIKSTILNAAVRGNCVNIVRAIAPEVDVNKHELYQDIQYSKKELWKTGRSPLASAAGLGFLEVVKILLGSDAIKSLARLTALQCAAMQGHSDVEKYLVENISDEQKDNLLHLLLSKAASKGDIDDLKYLMEGHNVNVKVCNIPSASYLGALKYLIDKMGVDISVASGTGRIVLHCAALKGALDWVQYLIEIKNLDMNAKDEMEATLLHCAAKSGNINLLKYLMEEKHLDVDAVDKNNHGLLHYASSSGRLDTLKYLVEERSFDVNLQSPDGASALHAASALGSLDIVKYLVERHADANGLSKICGPSLQVAAAGAHLDVVKYFIDTCTEFEDLEVDLALLKAVQAGCLDTVKYLVEVANADISAKRRISGDDCLMLAIKAGDLDMVKYLAGERHADLYVMNTEEWTPVTLAAGQNNLHILRYLVEDLGMDCVSPNEVGWTALYLAALNFGEMEVITYLISKGADVNAVTTDKGRVPIQGATVRGKLDIVKYLISEGAILDNVDIYGHTLLTVATETGELELTKFYIEEKGLDISAKDIGSRTVLHTAVHSGNFELVKYLLEKGAQRYINAKRIDNGWTPLLEAVHKKYTAIARMLLENGASVDVCDMWYFSALHRACKTGSVDCFELLVSKGCNINPRNASGQTPLHVAAGCGHAEIVKGLVAEGANVSLKDKRGRTALDIARAERRQDVVKMLDPNMRNWRS